MRMRIMFKFYAHTHIYRFLGNPFELINQAVNEFILFDSNVKYCKI